MVRELILHPEGDRVTVWRTLADATMAGDTPVATINMTLSTLGSGLDESITAL